MNWQANYQNWATLSSSGNYSKRMLAIFVVLLSVLVDFNDLEIDKTILNMILPTQRQARSLYMLTLGEEKLEVPEIIDIGKIFV